MRPATIRSGRSAKTRQRAIWRNRIIGSGVESPKQLLSNPRNWRIHPPAQQKALAGVLRDVGWVQEIIINRRTGFIVDGHLRVALAIEENQDVVPVKYVGLSDEEEALVLATFDPIAAMSLADRAQLSALLQTARSVVEDPNIQTLFNRLDRNSLAPEALISSVDETTSKEDIYNRRYEVVVECRDETDQQELFNRLTEEGYKCRVLTL